MDLAQKKCVPCEGGVPSLQIADIHRYLSELKSGWAVIEAKKLQKEYRFQDFAEAMKFVNKVAAVADAEGHHPNIHIAYGRVTCELWTHAVEGLTENDFIVAAKIDALP